MIPENINPVLGLRALGTKAKISDANSKTIEDSRKIIAQELKIKDENFF